LLLAVTDRGVATCWEAATGKDVWQHRLGGTFTASPVLVGDLLFATNEDGATFVVKVSKKGGETIARNKLGDEVFATPTICGSRVYMRVANRAGGNRQEMLYCLSK